MQVPGICFAEADKLCDMSWRIRGKDLCTAVELQQYNPMRKAYPDSRKSHMHSDPAGQIQLQLTTSKRPISFDSCLNEVWAMVTAVCGMTGRNRCPRSPQRYIMIVRAVRMLNLHPGELVRCR